MPMEPIDIDRPKDAQEQKIKNKIATLNAIETKLKTSVKNVLAHE